MWGGKPWTPSALSPPASGRVGLLPSCPGQHTLSGDSAGGVSLIIPVSFHSALMQSLLRMQSLILSCLSCPNPVPALLYMTGLQLGTSPAVLAEGDKSMGVQILFCMA